MYKFNSTLGSNSPLHRTSHNSHNLISYKNVLRCIFHLCCYPRALRGGCLSLVCAALIFFTLLLTVRRGPDNGALAARGSCSAGYYPNNGTCAICPPGTPVCLASLLCLTYSTGNTCDGRTGPAQCDTGHAAPSTSLLSRSLCWVLNLSRQWHDRRLRCLLCWHVSGSAWRHLLHPLPSRKLGSM
jgi:hypothetical protein